MLTALLQSKLACLVELTQLKLGLDSAVLKFGNAELPASKIPSLRQAMWDAVVKRKHTISKVYPSTSSNDFILLVSFPFLSSRAHLLSQHKQGTVDLDYENGHKAHGTDFAARVSSSHHIDQAADSS